MSNGRVSRLRPDDMPDTSGVVVSIRDVERDYQGLRPLRVRSFELLEGQRVAILGMDRAPAEAFVNLVSGATLPDRGSIETLGRPTSSIATGDDWVSLLEKVGILSERSVLLGEMTVAQNLAMPFSLDIYELSADLRARVDALAWEVGLEEDVMGTPTAGTDALTRARVRLARAVAESPRLLLAEHPNALVDEGQARTFGEDIARVIAARRMAAVVLTANPTFARLVADSLMVHRPATGELTRASLWQRWMA